MIYGDVKVEATWRGVLRWFAWFAFPMAIGVWEKIIISDPSCRRETLLNQVISFSRPKATRELRARNKRREPVRFASQPVRRRFNERLTTATLRHPRSVLAARTVINYAAPGFRVRLHSPPPSPCFPHARSTILWSRRASIGLDATIPRTIRTFFFAFTFVSQWGLPFNVAF